MSKLFGTASRWEWRVDGRAGRRARRAIELVVLSSPGAPSSVLSISFVTPSLLYDDLTGVVITGIGFGAVEGTVLVGGRVQTVTNWTDTSITFTAERAQDPVGSVSLEVRKPL